MTSRFVTTGLSLSFLLIAAACGDSKPPATPDNNTTSMADSGADMAMSASDAGASMTGDAGGAMADTKPADPPKPAALALPSASAKLMKLKGKDIEIKSDGTVNTAGKPTHKVMGMELQDKDGKGLLKVDADNNVMQADGSAYAKFEGDDLTAMDTSKLSVGDDGVSQTDAKGKKTNLAKAEGIGDAKKATLLVVAFNLWGTKPPAAPKGAKPADKTGDKKPAGKK